MYLVFLKSNHSIGYGKMKNNLFFKRIVFVLFVLIGIVGSCQKKTTMVPVHETILKDFPNEIGDEWTYFYYDSLASYSDTVTVKIVSEMKLDANRHVKIWEYHYQTKIDTNYVEISGDTVKIYKNLKTQWENTKLVFPLFVGKGWKGDFLNDSSMVKDKLSISVKGHSFPNCYIIEESWGSFNDYGRVKTYFVPAVGIVKKHFSRGTFVFSNEYWELLNFSLVD